MIDQTLAILDSFEGIIWSYFSLPAILLLGVMFHWRSRFHILLYIPRLIIYFMGLTKSLFKKADPKHGVHPLKSFFASVGGAIGIGNIIIVCMAIKIGGPGTLIWMWVGGLCGMIVKYSEIYLGHHYRIQDDEGTYFGGPMYYLQKVYKWKWVPGFICVLLCLYGAEILVFNIMVESAVSYFPISKHLIVLILLALTLAVTVGGVERIGLVSSIVIPIFVFAFLVMSLWILWQNIAVVPEKMLLAFKSAFVGHGAVGAFAGAGAFQCMVQGVQRACYSGDIGIGYASIIHAEADNSDSAKQASLGIMDIILDTFVVCTLSLILVLVTDVWTLDVPPSLMIQTVFARYFPYTEFFMVVFIFLLGFSTVTAFLGMGIKSAQFISPKHGRWVYLVYSSAMLILFSYLPTALAASLMAIAGAILLLLNLWGLFKLRDKINFRF